MERVHAEPELEAVRRRQRRRQSSVLGGQRRGGEHPHARPRAVLEFRGGVVVGAQVHVRVDAEPLGHAVVPATNRSMIGMLAATTAS